LLIPANLPRSGVVEFVGRGESMTQLHEMLQQGDRLAVSAKTDADMTAHLSVAATFELSWLDLSTDAQHLGCGLSLFAAAPIPWSFVEQCFAEQDPEELEEWRETANC